MSRLQQLYEFRVLVTRQHDLQIPLSAGEEARMQALAAELGTDVPQLDDPNPATLLTERWRASFTLGGRFGAGVVHNASGAGVAITTTQTPAVGERVVLELHQPGTLAEYTFPGYVAWRVVKGTPSFGVRFHGVPSETRTNGRRASGVYPTDASPQGNGDPRRKAC